MAVSTNATATGVRTVLKPYSTSLSDTEIEDRISYTAELINAIIDKEYTSTTEPTIIRIAIEIYTAYNLIMTTFLDEKLDTVDWSFDDLKIEHGTDPYAIRDFAFKLREEALTLIGMHGINPRIKVGEKEELTGLSGETLEGLEDGDISVSG